MATSNLTRRFALALAIATVLAAAAPAVTAAAAFPGGRPGHWRGAGDRAATIAGIARETAAIRGLAIVEPVRADFLDRQEVLAELEAEFDETYPPAEIAAEERLLAVLDLAGPDIDLRELSIAGAVQSLGGYYDPETGRLVVIDDDGAFRAVDRIVLAHEVTHALQDQSFDLLPRFERLEEEPNDDGELALRALIEGDARTTEAEYMRRHTDLSAKARAELTEAAAAMDFPSAFPPDFLVSASYFPYEAGAVFIRYLLHHGGWDAVNRAYAAPPTTTEQILHPERYLARDEPQPVTLPDLSRFPGSAWVELTSNAFGEFQVGTMLLPFVDQAEAHRAQTGWDGDRYALWSNGRDELFVWESAWDSTTDADEFAAALERRQTRAPGSAFRPVADQRRVSVADEAAYSVEIAGTRVRFVMAPNEASMNLVVAAFGPFDNPRADDDGPAAAAGELSRTTVDCETRPRSLPDVLAVLTEVENGDAAIDPAFATSTVVTGARGAVTEQVESAIQQTILERAACESQAAWFSAAALSTDDDLRRQFAWHGAPTKGELMLVAMMELSSVAMEPVAIVAIGDPRRLDDGRVAVLYTAVNPSRASGYTTATTTYAVFAEQDGRWLFDETYYAF